MKRLISKILFLILLVLLINKTNAQSFSAPLSNSGWYLSQDFGVWNSSWDGYHLGEDYVSNNKVELPVYSVSDGTVKHVASHTGYGFVVIIEHVLDNGSKVCSVYGHMRAASIAVAGKSVSKGELIGYLSNSYDENGGYNFTHLHFGIRSGAYSETSDNDGKWRYRGYGPNNIRDLWYDGSEFINSHQTSTVPILSGPDNNSVRIKDSNILFSWSSVPNASFYEIWIDNNDGFGSPEIGFNNGSSLNWVNNGIVSTNNFTLTTSLQNLLPQNVYYWKVRALDADQKPLTTWSEMRVFSLMNSAPNPPNILHPTNNIEITKGYILAFLWSSVANASFYEIWIDNNSGFGSPEVGFNNGVSANWIDRGIGSSNSFTLTIARQNLLPQNLYYWKVRALDANKNPLTKFSEVRSFSLLDTNNVTIINDELNGSTLGDANGISYVETPNGQGALFSRATEGRIEYPFSKGLPHEGTIEMLIKVTKGYSYDNYSLLDDQQSAFIFNTGPSDVWYLGAMWLVVNKNGDVSLSTALTTTPTSHTLSALNTTFRFNEWHIVSFSYGNQGQYLKVDGQLVASNTNYTETLQACGDWGNERCEPTIGEIKSVFWGNNRYDQGFEGVLDRFRASNAQRDWLYSANTTELIEIPEDNNQIELYPNPVSDKLIIETVGRTRNSTIDIINSIGQVIYSNKLSETTIINTISFSNGIYIVKLNIDNKIIFKKIIKK